MWCVAYVTQKFGENVVIVFGGYPQKPTTNNHTHTSRGQSTGTGADVQETATTKLAIKRMCF